MDKPNIEKNPVKFFMKHLVPILFTFKRDKNSFNMIITAFVLSVNDNWFLVTAGHCIKEIETYIETGYQVTTCYLIDFLGAGAANRQLIPFNYEDADPVQVYDSAKLDYGLISLSPYYRQLLEVNNIEPLDEKMWEVVPSDVDFYMLIGISGETFKLESGRATLMPTLHPVTQVEERPAGFQETNLPLFYGRITLDEEMTSIKGMSGAPIFAFKKTAEDWFRYWLVALQSSWLPNSRHIAAFPTNLLGITLGIMFDDSSESKHID